MTDQPPEQETSTYQERRQGDRRQGDRRGQDRRKGPRRMIDRIRDMGDYQALTFGDKVFLVSLVLFAAVLLGAILYAGVWLFKGGLSTQTATTAVKNQAGSPPAMASSFVPADNTVYALELCPQLMMDNTLKMRLFQTIHDFNECESKFEAYRRLDSQCEDKTIALLEANATVKTGTCNHLGMYRSRWCKITVQSGPKAGTSGFVPWGCLKNPPEQE